MAVLCGFSKGKSEYADIRPMLFFFFSPFSGALLMSMEEILLPLLSGLTAFVHYVVAPFSCTGY